MHQQIGCYLQKIVVGVADKGAAADDITITF